MDQSYGRGYFGGQDHPRPPPTQSSTQPYSSRRRMNEMHTGHSPHPTQQQTQRPLHNIAFHGPVMYQSPYQHQPPPAPPPQAPQNQPFQFPQSSGPGMFDPIPGLYTGDYHNDMNYNQSTNFGVAPGFQNVHHGSGYQPPPFFSGVPQPPAASRFPVRMGYRDVFGHQFTHQESHVLGPTSFLTQQARGMFEPPPKACMVCLEEPSQFAHFCTKCLHGQVCSDCIKDWFMDACKNESKMPPKCCEEIPLASVSKYLSPAEIELYNSKYEEWKTPNRIYCPVPTCSTFIPPRLYTATSTHPNNYYGSALSQPRQPGSLTPNQTISQPRVACPSCYTSICTNCRLISHMGACQSDLDPELEARLKRWSIKRCPKCRTGIKKIAGCSHVECRCGGEFCFSCLKPFNICGGSCENIYEERIIPLGRSRLRTVQSVDEAAIEAEDKDLDTRASTARRSCQHVFFPWRRPVHTQHTEITGPECQHCLRGELLQGNNLETQDNMAWSCVYCPSIICGACRRDGWI